jgi:gamma-glutamyl:cysteine ligase YbdK (ATP-grasp superfamily)
MTEPVTEPGTGPGTGRAPLHLFEAFGVELEYMLVDRGSLAVLPVTDEVLKAVAGAYVSDVQSGELAWSNELVLHVLELKTNGPVKDLAPLPALFARDVARINGLLERLGGCLMPTAMHPWMDPLAETRLWPHEYSPVYEAFDRIFGCRGHGWSNLQSCHINLPFAGDEEFARLHAGIRLLLPLLPALAASSPVVEGRLTGLLDNRLEAYRTNSRMIPAVAGEIIPEPVYSRAAYEAEILEPAYRAVAPHDPEGVLQDEFLNARGAIARFSRGSIEIRLLDVQEHPAADVAVVALVVAALRLLAAERWAPLARQQAWPVEPLAALFRRTLAHAEETVVEEQKLVEMFGLSGEPTAGEVWRHLAEEAAAAGLLPKTLGEPLEVIFTRGTLARRIVAALGDNPSKERQERVYRELCRCLAESEPFLP